MRSIEAGSPYNKKRMEHGVSRFKRTPGRVKTLVAIMSLAALSACAGGADRDPSDGIFDPYETQNRNVHEFNKGVDRAILRPVALGYSAVLPDDIEIAIGNAADNIDQPGVFVNSILQGDLRGAGISTSRFLINSTVGFLGLFDAATDFGIEQHDTDFGETLSVWGVEEGAYVELPVFGPSTTRDAAGRFVDFFTNPLDYVLNSPESDYAIGAEVGSLLGARGRFTNTIDGVLYESADSYAQSRLIYLQNRRFRLGQSSPDADIDPFVDPYEDPYAE